MFPQLSNNLAGVSSTTRTRQNDCSRLSLRKVLSGAAWKLAMASTYSSESKFEADYGIDHEGVLEASVHIGICSYLIEQQSCFLTLTERQFSKKTAFDFLEDLAQVVVLLIQAI